MEGHSLRAAPQCMEVYPASQVAHDYCVHSSKDNWWNCPSLHHKRVLSNTGASCQSFCIQHHESTPQIVDLRTKKAFPTSNSCKLQPLFIKLKALHKKMHSKTQKTRLALSRFAADSLLWHQEHPQQKPFRLAPKKCQMLLYSWQTCLSFQLTLDNRKKVGQKKSGRVKWKLFKNANDVRWQKGITVQGLCQPTGTTIDVQINQ